MKGDFSRSSYRSGNHYSSVRLQQGRVLLDAEWNEQADIDRHVDRGTTGDVVGLCGAPKAAPGAFLNFQVAVEPGDKDLRIAPGRIYVDGILCENDAAGGVLYRAQPDLPGAEVPSADGSYAVYLDVWERHVTAADQLSNGFPPLREAALGGPDTATRTRVVWQVRLAPMQVKDCGAFAAPAAPTGKLRAQVVTSPAAASDCLVPSGGGYRRLENQLYRVEIHTGGAGKPDYKWSRDNGAVVSRVKAVDAGALTIAVQDEDRDEALGFAGATWVELTDEERCLRGEPGALLEVKTVTGSTVTVLNPDNLSLGTGTNPTLRRWDGRGTLTANAPVELEDGVQVEVDGGTFAAGDYWLIPARTLTGNVEWPVDGAIPPAAIFEPRHGTAHHCCVLAMVDFNGGVFSAVVDCRALFPPLTDITAADVSYDPAKCSDLSTAKTVQDAIDLLCQATGGVEPGIHIERVTLMSGKPLGNDGLVTPDDLAKGIRISCDKPLFQDSVRNQNGLPNPVCRVTLDLPWPTNPADRDLWRVANPGYVGFQTITLAATVNADNNDIAWVPINKAPVLVAQWLTDTVQGVVDGQTHGQLPRLLVRLTLKGNFIWGPKEPELYLDGEVFGVPAAKRVAIRLPSGNDRRGGDFDMWFWLTRDVGPVPPDHFGVFPGRLSAFFTTAAGRQAIGLAIDRGAPALVDALPANYAFDASQPPFNPIDATKLAKKIHVDKVNLAVASSLEPLGKALAAVLAKNTGLAVDVVTIGDADLLDKVKAAVAAGNAPDMVVGNDALAQGLTGIGYGDGIMIRV